MNINELKPAEGSKKERKRIGRGHGTGWGKTAGKGHNGQKQRSGTYVSASFEGGQMPLIRRIPKRGFSNAAFKKDLVVVNLKDFIDKYEDGETVSLETLIAKGVVKNPSFRVRYTEDGLRDRQYTSILKVIGVYEINKKLKFVVEKISKSAKELVEKAGGTVELLEVKSYSKIAKNNK
ncbi:50S ribosomal protein L15 [Sneathia sanguinegens]|uniref:Large ribosomal subunit protein uL15 n=1 Tax=Sneathia sanguinegens TaxID=40543 RepID=A0ABT7HMN1_9FUSO|nr:50S ribosomal protein L15 [Sneathia sanguinegens]MDK9581145.1 50S ribosomal protein L15 [Sneathia sanguinegens]MDU4652868.1 50S ribosomal protein L15 [Sneathia sanguinegens]MDU7497411.1 50S ribosomal protein L15 [Sneathia sanguinegens]